MNSELRIETNWLGNNVGDDLEKAFYADIDIAIDEDHLTRLEDLLANTVRNNLRGNAYQLATWFAANWWRIRWEPEISEWSKDPDWRMAHSIASAGGGFVWPNVVFASDGESIAIASRLSEFRSVIEPVRYLKQTIKRISSASFEQSVDMFLEGVLSRLQTLKLCDETLHGLWNETLAERRDPNIAAYRKLEAICGYDPDESPDGMIQNLLDYKNNFGSSAIEEIAAAGRQDALARLQQIASLAKAEVGNIEGGIHAKFPQLPSVPIQHQSERPWQLARRFAKLARQAWDLGDGRIEDKVLTDLVDARSSILDGLSTTGIPMSLALRGRDEKTFSIYLESKWKVNNRFALARLIGDNLGEFSTEQLHPATKAKTARQQFQRAFGQEFLCPFDTLKSMVGTDLPDDDDIDEAADYFQVSPLLVKTTLVNKGELDRESLRAA